MKMADADDENDCYYLCLLRHTLHGHACKYVAVYDVYRYLFEHKLRLALHLLGVSDCHGYDDQKNTVLLQEKPIL